ncbi:hypothetical protein V7159_23500, partial [Priestia megaterium]|uniref:hypothetical protein n=1 Tax=Priestia megaterium TaxID=1404 RepID=UPI00300A5C5A
PSYPNVINIQAQSDRSVGGGALFDGVFMFNIKPTTGIFASGNGYITMKNWFSYDFSENFSFLSLQNNLLADGSFNNGSLVDNWFISADSSPIVNRNKATNLSLGISAEDSQSFTQSLEVKKLTFGGQTAKICLAVPTSNNDVRYSSSFYYKKANANIGTGKVYVDMKWAIVENNKDGVPFIKYSSSPLSSSVLDLSNVNNWVNVRSSPKVRKPSWATHIILDFNLSELTTGNTFYIDDVYLGEL